MKPATKAEFDLALRNHPLAVPDGWRIVGGLTQTRWMEGETEIARESFDSFGPMFDVQDDKPATP